MALFAGMVVAACVDYAGPPPEQQTQNNQPTTPPNTTPPNTTPPVTTPSTGGGTPGTPSESDPDANAGGDEPSGAADLVSFDEDVHPILVEKCGMCHGEDAAPLPTHGAEDADASFAATQGMSTNEPVYDRILARASGEGGFMPPGYIGCEGPLGSPSCLTVEEYETIELWVEQGASNR